MSDTNDLELEMAAFSSAVSEMLASVMGKIVVVRQMLAERSVFSDSEYKIELKLFAEQRWPTFVSDVSKRLKDLAEDKEHRLRERRKGPVN